MANIAPFDLESPTPLKEEAAGFPKKRRKSTHNDTALKEDSVAGTFYQRSPNNSCSQEGILKKQKKFDNQDLSSVTKQILQCTITDDREHSSVDHSMMQRSFN